MCRGAASDLTGSRTRRTPPTWTSSNGRADENAEVWERFLSQPLDVSKLIMLD